MPGWLIHASGLQVLPLRMYLSAAVLLQQDRQGQTEALPSCPCDGLPGLHCSNTTAAKSMLAYVCFVCLLTLVVLSAALLLTACPCRPLHIPAVPVCCASYGTAGASCVPVQQCAILTVSTYTFSWVLLPHIHVFHHRRSASAGGIEPSTQQQHPCILSCCLHSVASNSSNSSSSVSM
jgi:hypothetical protein